jgi:hypothetical protein
MPTKQSAETFNGIWKTKSRNREAVTQKSNSITVETRSSLTEKIPVWYLGEEIGVCTDPA